LSSAGTRFALKLGIQGTFSVFKGIGMSKVLTAVLLVLSFSAAAQSLPDEVNPVPLKERIKWQMWEQGVPQFKRPISTKQAQIPEEIGRILEKQKL